VPPKPGANASRLGRHMDSYGGLHEWGIPNSWIVFLNGKSEKIMDDLGVPPFFKPPFHCLIIKQ
jgi:hypothetical protein